MGKVPAPTPAPASTAAMRRQKKGRPPSKVPLPPSSPPPTNSNSRRSTRLNPNHFNSPLRPDFDSGDDDDDERKEKKVKLVVRLPQSDKKSTPGGRRTRRHSRDSDSGSGSGSDSGSDRESEDHEGCAKKRKIDGSDRGSDGGDLAAQDKEGPKATDTPPNGSQQLESGPTTPLPDKKLLVFILDRLQKKDTYGVFSEPVDRNELPDYFDVIERPMDFGTVKKQLDTGAYKSLEELEADVFLICSNAMQYNSSDTVYYRQARSIQELARRDFENLKHEGANGEPQPKVVRRGRPPNSKNQKKPPETSMADNVERVGTEVLLGATLASEEDKLTGSGSYNLRKGPALLRSRFADSFASSHRARNGENYSENSVDWNTEFPAPILRADLKHGKKHLTVDENKRDTYRQSLSSGNNLPVSFGNMKRLVPVGLQDSLAYARSLARYAANLGPVAWKIASKKIDAVLPSGMEYGPGWVGENPASQPVSHSTEKQTSSTNSAGDCSSLSKLRTPAAAADLGPVSHQPSNGPAEAAKNLNGPNELTRGGDTSSLRPQLQNPGQQSNRNGFTGVVGPDRSASGAARVEDRQSSGMMEHGDADAVPEQGKSMGEAGMWNLGKSPQVLAVQQQRHLVPPDLNVRVPAVSPGSSLQIRSPRQPDLALQL